MVLEFDPTPTLALIDARRERIARPRPALEAIAGVMRQALGRRFQEGGPGWQELAPSTVAMKRMMRLPYHSKSGRIAPRLKQNGAFGPGNILLATGALRDSYRQKNARGHWERVDESTGSVMVGSALPYAAYHQYGTAAYIIRARYGHALAFGGPEGQTLFAKVVHHPGLAARPVALKPEDIAACTLVMEIWISGGGVGNGANI